MSQSANATTGNEVLSLLEALIRCPSQTPDDAGCCKLITDRLKPLGFSFEYLNVEGVTNLWATRGSGAPLIVLAGHTDVVPPGPIDQWHSDPYVPTQRDGHLYGRGAADMKSGLSAMVHAVECLLATHEPKGTLAFLITSDEEGKALHGTRHVCTLLEERGIKPDYAIVGEASSLEQLGDRIMIGRRGSLGCDLRVLGTQGHVAYPDRADNPIHRLSMALSELLAQQWDEGNGDFSPTSLQVSNFNAGTGANNVIPGHADIIFNFRYSPESDADTLKRRVHAILDRHIPRYEANWWHSGEPFHTPGGPLVEAATAAVQEVTGLTPRLSTGGGTSDGRFLAPLGAQVVEIGPVNATIHRINERVLIDSLQPLSDIYLGVLKKLT